MIEKKWMLFVVCASVFIAGLSGCSHQSAAATDANGKEVFKAGPGVPADVIAKMNAAKANGAGQTK